MGQCCPSPLTNSNTGDIERKDICEMLEVNVKDKPGKYLGMPMYVERSKKEIFGFISDKIQRKLQSWSNKELSKAGKLTLVGTAAQTTPNFWMSLFWIPDAICDEIERKMNGFLWGNATGRGVKWITWKKLCVPKEFGGLGLKELKKFNTAMLAKQGWRLLTEANPLVSAVMKAKYYPQADLLNAELGNNPSYVWRGIVAALEVLRSGARRRIGNGENTLVWRDPWLPDIPNGYIRTAVYDQLKNIKVCNLMINEGNEWDLEVINDLFEAGDCEKIQRIPLSRHVPHDSWYWLLEDKGVFTVKSCYRFLQGECADDYKGLWKKIWAMKLPRKVTHVLWRLCKECLPTNAALYNRYVDVNPTCPWCHSAAETNLHAIFLCDFALTMWRAVGLQSLVLCTEQETPKEVFDRVFHQGSKDQCLEVSMLCWSLWHRRNKWVWDRVNGSIFGVRNTANCLLREWTEAQAREVNMKIGGKVGDRVWSKPTGWVKINVDAAVFMMGGIGVAAVIRDDQGAFVAARVRKLSGKWSPREAEALALKEALSWVLNRGYMHCEFQTDCYALAASCNGSPRRSLFDTIVINCIGLSKHINQVLFSFAFRSANNVAHVLAQAAYSMSDVGEWFVTTPNFLVRSLELDSII